MVNIPNNISIPSTGLLFLVGTSDKEVEWTRNLDLPLTANQRAGNTLTTTTICPNFVCTAKELLRPQRAIGPRSDIKHYRTC